MMLVMQYEEIKNRGERKRAQKTSSTYVDEQPLADKPFFRPDRIRKRQQRLDRLRGRHAR